MPPEPVARASAEPADPGPRRSAGERRRQLVEAAVGAFAHTGLHGTAVSAVTDRVGVTQPYAFSLFRTKKGLFLAAVEHCFDHVEQTFRAGAAGRSGADALEAMGDAYHALLEDRDWLLLQLQAYAACGDEEVRAVVRRRFAALYELVGELSGAEDLELRDFFAAGMLMNVAAAMDLPELAAEEEGWIERCRAPLRP
ncbi:MAG TPA: TetR/AcrR family transcriptional regulator [Solirubrobacteraceae bacterium]|nr:TetR/AcrR family transcriptional regulator [Solirubrobacteraceae bacterium]HSD80113.1 TetR/AcrR family transcriptional regulator [Solirubrobacteraceae bacterium]